MELFEYQKQIVQEAIEKLKRSDWIYLALDMRTGKTIISLTIAKELGLKRILVIYPNKNVIKAFEDIGKELELDLTFSSNHPDTIKKHIGKDFDCIILDEAHNFKSFPKPSKRAKVLRELIKRCKKVKKLLLSGTPHPESYSDLYYQLWSIGEETHKTFYEFAEHYVNIKEKYVAGGVRIKDYSDCSKYYFESLKKNFIILSKEEAGITTKKNIIFEKVEMKNSEKVFEMIKKGIINIKDLVVIPIDSISKELQTIRQICGGVLYDSNKEYIIDYSKAKRIEELLKKYNKVLVFYYYQKERELLLKYFGDIFTEDLNEAKNSNKHLLLQLVSGREGITFPEADAIIYYSLDFSAVTYIQSQERATTFNKNQVDIVYLFSSVGFDETVYKTLKSKKKYTEKLYQSQRNSILKSKTNQIKI
ncbi:MAG: DEAD/DEAH box helicase family protein [Candidatus Anstonellales archaeon]